MPRDPQTRAYDDLLLAIEDTFRRRPETTEGDVRNALHDVAHEVPELAESGRAQA